MEQQTHTYSSLTTHHTDNSFKSELMIVKRRVFDTVSEIDIMS
jgi:hypothetical protein